MASLQVCHYFFLYIKLLKCVANRVKVRLNFTKYGIYRAIPVNRMIFFIIDVILSKGTRLIMIYGKALFYGFGIVAVHKIFVKLHNKDR